MDRIVTRRLYDAIGRISNMLEELQFGFPILTFLTFFPLVGALVIWAVKDQELIKK